MNNEFILPTSWYIVATEDNIEALAKWRFDGESPSRFLPGSIVGVHPAYLNHKDWNTRYTSDWVNEITFEQFRKYVLKETIEIYSEDYSYLIELFNKLEIK